MAKRKTVRRTGKIRKLGRITKAVSPSSHRHSRNQKY